MASTRGIMADSSILTEGTTELPTSISALVACLKLAPHRALVASSHSSEVILTLASVARALWRLSYEDLANQLQIAASGGISPLAQLLTYTEHQDVIQAVCGCLWNLAANTTLHAAVGSSGVIPLLVQLMQGEHGTPTALEQAAGLLNILSNNSIDNCRQITLNGGITTVVRILCAPTSTDNTRQYSASTLCSLALTDSSNQKLITAAGGIMAVLPLIQPQQPSQALLRQAVLTLKVLALDADNQTIIGALGGIQALINILSGSTCEAVLWSTAGALRNIVCDHVINQAALVSAPGALLSIVRVLQDKTHTQAILQQTVTILTCLSCNPAVHQALCTEPGCVTALLQLLDPQTSCTATMETAATAIGLLSTNPPAQAILRRVGAISILVRLLGNSACTEQLYRSVGSALVSLGHNNPSRQAAIRGAGAIGSITQLLKQSSKAADDKPQLSNAAAMVLQQLLSMLQSNLSKQSAPIGEQEHSIAAAHSDHQPDAERLVQEDYDATETVSELTTGMACLSTAAKPTAAATSVLQDGSDNLASAGDLADTTSLLLDQDDLPASPASNRSPSSAAVGSSKSSVSRSSDFSEDIEPVGNDSLDASTSASSAVQTADRDLLSGQTVVGGCHVKLAPATSGKGTQPAVSSSSSSSKGSHSRWSDVVRMQSGQQHVSAKHQQANTANQVRPAAQPQSGPGQSPAASTGATGAGRLSWSSIVKGSSSKSVHVQAKVGPAETTSEAAPAQSTADDPWSLPSFSSADEPSNGVAATLSGDQGAIPGPARVSSAALRSQLCLVCGVAQRTVLLLPCRHLAICKDCGDDMQQTAVANTALGYRGQAMCPKCSAVVQKQLTVFQT